MPTLSPEAIESCEPKHLGYGLPCAKCRAYYAAALTVCPICGCPERVPANSRDVPVVRRITASQMTTANQRTQ